MHGVRVGGDKDPQVLALRMYTNRGRRFLGQAGQSVSAGEGKVSKDGILYEQVKVIHFDSPLQAGTFKGFFGRSDDSHTGCIRRLGLVWGDIVTTPSTDSKDADTNEFEYADEDGDGAQVKQPAAPVEPPKPEPPKPEPPKSNDQLGSDQALAQNQALTSRNGKFKFMMQDDGNFVLYGPGGPTWSSNTGGRRDASKVIMQPDGNLVMYTNGGQPVWASNTGGQSGDLSFVVQDDGNAVIYASGKAVWATNTAH